ncbi:ATP-binding cassette domain-containing protein [Candidatus Phytoplasma oryzae]|nr:ABC transporter ATP-binding protein [Candidatus Phytoplasma oryzae]
MIKIKNIYKTYFNKKKKVNRYITPLKDFSINLPNKGMIFLLGKSGSGKTTLCQIISGIDKISSGQLYINNVLVSNLKQKKIDDLRNGMMGCSFQDTHLIEDITVYENIALSAELQGKKIEEEIIDSYLKNFDLDIELKKELVKNLSGGEKQRINIIRSLIKDSNIILADEPTSNLDVITKKKVLDKFQMISKEKLVIIISHDILNAYKYADRIIEIENGSIKKDITRKQINKKIIPNQKNNIIQNNSESNFEITKNIIFNIQNEITDKKNLKNLKFKSSCLKFKTILKMIWRSFKNNKKLLFGSLIGFIMLLFNTLSEIINVVAYSSFYRNQFTIFLIFKEIFEKIQTLFIFKATKIENIYFLISLGFSITPAILLISKFFNISVKNKSQEVINLKFLGANKWSILKIFFIECIIICAILSFIYFLIFHQIFKYNIPILFYENKNGITSVNFFTSLKEYFQLPKYLINWKDSIQNFSEQLTFISTKYKKIILPENIKNNQNIYKFFLEYNSELKKHDSDRKYFFLTTKEMLRKSISLFSLHPIYRIIFICINLFVLLFIFLYIWNLFFSRKLIKLNPRELKLKYSK